jgi:hypothetical protein
MLLSPFGDVVRQPQAAALDFAHETVSRADAAEQAPRATDTRATDTRATDTAATDTRAPPAPRSGPHVEIDEDQRR